jgi:DNA-binding SARP family transcriptional activator
MPIARSRHAARGGVPDPALVIRLLGEPEWQRAGGEPQRFSDKDAALVAKLALDGPQARAELCELLWPDSSPQKGYANLRSRASRLHVASKVTFIEIEERIRLTGAVSIDILQIANIEPSVLMNAGPLLAGVDVGDHDELDRWVTAARTRVAESCADVLGGRADVLEREGRLQDALALARCAVALQPLAEAGWYRLMQFHYLRNDRAAAQETFARCAAVLRDELGIRPGAPLLELMQTVVAADRAPVSRHRPVPASVLRPPTLIGRHQAWQSMWSAWQRHQPFLVVGDAGLGKSRLLEEFCRGQDGIVEERGSPGDETAPYALLGRLLVAIEHRFAPAFSSADRVELARLRPEFGAASAAPANAMVLERAIENMLAAALPNGLRAVVIDDLHNADTSTIDALRRLGGRKALDGLHLGLATRPAAPEGMLGLLSAWAEDSDRLVRIDLAPLTSQELAELLASLMLPSLLDSSFASRIYRHAGGHPLYTLATLHAAFAAGSDPMSSALATPDSIQALLDARVASLPPATHDLLRVAAIAGQDLNAERAARMLDCSVLALADRWADLEAADVLRGEAFSHDLVCDAALRTVPRGVRQALHRQFAALLTEDASVSPARLAWHWERGERMSEAARCWHGAGKAARAVALLEQQTDLYGRAARCYEAAGDSGARFEALIARLEGMQLRPGGAAVLEALVEVEPLADTDERRLRCRLARAEACLGVEQPEQTVKEAQAAVHESRHHPRLLADAEALLAQGLVQCQHFDAAVETATHALEAARSAGDPWQTLRALQALSFVHYAMGQVPEALDWQQQAVVLAKAIGHRFEAAAGEGHVAALWSVVGDMPRAYEHATEARERQREVGLDEDGTLCSVNHRVLGAAAAVLGRFDEAIEALLASVATAGAKGAPGALAKARLSLAGLWLTLGRTDLARASMDEIVPDDEPARKVQQYLLLAQAADADGASGRRFLSAIGKIGAEHPDLPLVRSFWFEWSYQGSAVEVVDRLQRVRLQCESLKLYGTARAFQWRELVRWLDITDPGATVAALAHARQLEPHVDDGMSAKCHPPQLWFTLAQAYARAGEHQRQSECLACAERWLGNALSRVPPQHRDAFVNGNPLHRMLLNRPQG